MDTSEDGHALHFSDRPPIPLTELEYQIVERLRWGQMDVPDIAHDLSYSPQTIRNYLTESIYPMLGVHSRLHAVMLLMSARIT